MIYDFRFTIDDPLRRGANIHSPIVNRKSYIVNLSACCKCLQCLVGAMALSVCLTSSVEAVRAGRWEFTDRAAFSQSKIEGFEISQEGRLRLGISAVSIPVPADYIWSIVEFGDDVYVGAGDGAKILKARRDMFSSQRSPSDDRADARSPDADDDTNAVTVAWAGDGLEVYALAKNADGELLAGVSPLGMLLFFTLHNENGESLAVSNSVEIPDSYIWRIVPVGNDVWIASGSGRPGTGGAIYRYRRSTNKLELIYRSSDPHILSLVRSGERIYAGSQGPAGLIYVVTEIGSDSPRISVAFDPPQNEIVDLAAAADGSVYAVALSQTSGRPPSGSSDASPGASESSGGGGGDEPDGEEASSTPEPPPTPRPPSNAGQTIYRIDPAGKTDVWIAARSAIRSIVYGRRGLLVANTDQGNVFRIDGASRSSLVLSLDEKLILSMSENYIGTGKPAKLYRIRKNSSNAMLKSQAMDAGAAASWGVATFEAEGPWELRTRTGNSETPNSTWSEWSSTIRSSGARIESPIGRYLQFEVKYKGGKSTDSLRLPAFTYQVWNRAPRLNNLTIKKVSFDPRSVAKFGRAGPLGPIIGQFAQAAKNASNPSGGEVGEFTFEELLRPFAGMMQLNWTAEDPDNDKLSARIEVIDDSTSQSYLVAEKHEGDAYLLNTGNFPDGRYHAIVTVTDASDNNTGSERKDTATSEAFVVDNTPPEIWVQVKEKDSGVLEITGRAMDRSGRIASLLYFDERGKWQRLLPDDGIADQAEESFRILRPLSGANSGNRAIVIKAIDQNGNVGYARAAR